MKRILLADDDFLALNAFYSLLDWEAYDLAIVHEAHDGPSAIAFLEQQPVDIAFLDVCMPGMDGLALLKCIKQRSPETLCIMLSAYSDFPYVRDALKQGAVDYILKYELTADVILSLLQQHGIATIKRPSPVSYDELLQQVLDGKDVQAHVPSGLLLLGKQTRGRPILDAQQHSLFQTCRHIFHEYTPLGICMFSSQEIAVYFPHLQEGNAAFRDAIRIFHNAVHKYFNLDFTFSEPIAIHGCKELTAYAHAFGNSQLSTGILHQAEKSALIQAVCAHHTDIVAQRIHGCFQATPQHAWSTLKTELLDVYYHLSVALTNVSPVPALPRAPSDWEEYFIERFSHLAATCNPEEASGDAIFKALTFLRHHYSQPVRLSDVADDCGLSVSHLSTLFKRQFGMTILTYIKRLRIYHAAYAMLYNNLSFTDIADAVGFHGYNHFFDFFRETTGMTPSKFKQSPSASAWLAQEKERLFFSK